MMINLFVIVQDIICLLKLQSGKKILCQKSRKCIDDIAGSASITHIKNSFGSLALHLEWKFDELAWLSSTSAANSQLFSDHNVFIGYVFTSLAQLMVGTGFPEAEHSNVTSEPFLTTMLPSWGTGFTRGGTGKQRGGNKLLIFAFCLLS